MFQRAKETIVIPEVLKPKVVDGLPGTVVSFGKAVDSWLFMSLVGILLSVVVAIVAGVVDGVVDGVVGGGPLQ